MQGKTISGYTLQRPIGTGGMAEVWYAENKIGKKAAVKLLLPKLCQDENVKSRFLTEAEVMVKLSHPNIRQVYDYGDIDGRPAIVMEYLDGDDLKARMKRGQHFTEKELEHWWNQLVDALNYTHSEGIIHRDIKPGNIFVNSEGNIKLLDFGIAKVRESISSTQTGQKLGTLMYMSPEQVKDSKHIDYRTDVYSLAVTFVHLLTGKRPYDSDTSSDFEISEQIVYKPLDLSGVPKGWQGFLAPYLEKEPDKRPALRNFESVMSVVKPTKADDDDATVVENVKQLKAKPVVQPTPKPQPKTEKPKAQTPEPSEKPKKKTGLWIGIGAAGAAVVAAVVVLVIFLTSGNSVEKTFEKGKAFYDAKNYTDALPLLTEAAEKGHSNAQYWLGKMYSEGMGVDKDPNKAFELAYKSAMQDDAMGQNLLGWMYSNGKGVAQDYNEAMNWYRKAAAQGNMKAQDNIGILYRDGKGVEQNFAESVNWFRMSVEQGYAAAQGHLGYAYHLGQGVEQNYEEAAKWYRKAAEQDDSYGQFMLGSMYYYGQGVEQNYEEAMKWFRKAAEQGEEGAEYFIGEMYKLGLGVAQDYAEAMKWYRKAAEKESELSQFPQYEIGNLYYYGNGVEINYVEAAKWYRKAADAGYADAQGQLGYMYAMGQGVVDDIEEAVELYRKAAAQENSVAQYNLAQMYENGWGVNVDKKEAQAWYQKSADNGYELAKEKLQRFAKENAKGRLKGTVTDGYGACVGASISLSQLEKDWQTYAVTDIDGGFDFNGLAPGTYNMRVNHVGSASYLLKNITIQGGQTVNWNVKLNEGNVSLYGETVVDYQKSKK